MTVTPLSLTDETSLRYPGWRIVAVCFAMATFSWGLGFYGQSVYLPELQRLHGWQTSWISTATTIYYLVGAALVMVNFAVDEITNPRLRSRRARRERRG